MNTGQITAKIVGIQYYRGIVSTGEAVSKRGG
jgi:hypothetical protein